MKYPQLETPEDVELARMTVPSSVMWKLGDTLNITQAEWQVLQDKRAALQQRQSISVG